MNKEALVTAIGYVQGVGFRMFVRRMARKRQITGWVKNGSDGHSLFALLQGKESEVEEMISLIRNGPPGSRVRELNVEWREPTQTLPSFDVRK